MLEINLTISIVISLVIAFFITLFQYSKYKRKAGIYLWIALFRFLGLFCIILLLIGPEIQRDQTFSEKPRLTLLVDNSSSIAHLGYDSISKHILQELSQDKTLQDRFEIETLVFDQHFIPQDSLQYNGRQTNIYKALQLSLEPNQRKPAAIVLLSDGNQTIGKDFTYALDTDSITAVYPVLMGDSTIALDLNIGRLNTNKYVYHNNKFPVEVFVHYQGEEPLQTNVSIYQGNRLLQREGVKFNSGTAVELLNFEIDANTPGLNSYRAVVESYPREKNTLNNSKSFAVEVIDQKSNIAIISTVVHPDLGALKKSIESNEYRSVKLINPTVDPIKLEEFEMFILYQPNEKFQSIISQLKRDQRNYWLITGEDTQWSFLNRQDLGFLKRPQNQIEEIMPLDNPAFTLFGTEELSFEHMPPLTHQMGTLDIVDKTDVLLHQKVAGVETLEPLLMVFEDPSYKRAILDGEGVWRWRSSTYIDTGSYNLFDSYIGNIIQYLSNTKARKRLEVIHEPYYYENSKPTIKAHYYDKNYRPQSNGRLTIILKDRNSNQNIELPLLNKGRFYEVDLSNLEPSIYDYTVNVSTEDLSQSGHIQILPFEVEKQFVNPNIKKLNQLAEKHHGTLYFADQIQELKFELSSSNLYLPIQRITQNIVPLVHWKWLLALAVLFLSGEWFLRKYNGLI